MAGLRARQSPASWCLDMGHASVWCSPTLVGQSDEERDNKTMNPARAEDMGSILERVVPDPLPTPRGSHDNAIHHVNIALFGKPNTGKTSLAESIVEWAITKYGASNVWAIRSTRDLPALFQSLDKMGHPQCVVLFADDMTKALDKLSGTIAIEGSMVVAGQRMNRKSYWMDKWYDIRGELAKRGMRSGLVLMVGAVHRFYGMPIDMRADVDVLLCRSTATKGTFDARTVEKMLGTETYNALRHHESLALRDRVELGWTGWATKAGSGIVFVPPPIGNYMATVYSAKPRVPGPWGMRLASIFILGILAYWVWWLLSGWKT